MKLDQCLFGYEDGHRLLVSSMPLGDLTAWLTELSDLAPGTVFGKSDGYWTGIPAPELGRYVLMRTWPAPEMSRPGCVWTHALLIEPRIFERLPDLSFLQALPHRPRAPSDRTRYSEPLSLDDHLRDITRPITGSTEATVRKLLASLYEPTSRFVEVRSPGMADEALFAVWSQQWPRLRRNFRFQTAAARDPQPSSAKRFDFSIVFAGEYEDVPEPQQDGAHWLSAATADVAAGPNGALRAFLWRYGGDVRKQRGSFRPLTEIRLISERPDEDAGRRLLEVLTRFFPEKDDANRLKQDVIDGALAPTAQLDVLWFLLAEGGDVIFPPPSEQGIARLAGLWPQRAGDLLHLAEFTADANDTVGKLVFQTVTDAVPTDEFWQLTESYPRLRRQMLAARPELMLSKGILSLDNATLCSFIETTPTDSRFADVIIPYLLSREDEKLSDVLIGRYPEIVASQVVLALNSGAPSVSRTWLRGIVRRPNVLLKPSVMRGVTRATILYDLAEALGWLNHDVLLAGSAPWNAATAGSLNDMSGDRSDTLSSFLVAMALASGGHGGKELLETHFERVHSQILKSQLPWRARDILSPFLPNVGWLRGWDFGLRLRLAVANCYVQNSYDPQSYAMLAARSDERILLAEAAKEVPGGKPYARAASAY